MSQYYAIINKNTHSIIANYSASDIDYTKPGLTFDQSQLVHLIVPSEFIGNPFITVIQSNDQYTFQIDQVAVAQSVKEQLDALRQERNKKLSACDWIVSVSDLQISSEIKQQWIIYRQELRNLLQTTTDPSNPVWPTPPSSYINL